jgi:uncharacterized protein DUF7002
LIFAALLTVGRGGCERSLLRQIIQSYTHGAKPLQLEAFCTARPYLYHLTAFSNVNRIQTFRVIFPAAELMEQSGNSEFLRTRRIHHVQLTVDGETVLLRDQAPLYLGNMALPNGFSFPDFIESLNSRVFFWPGTSSGPIPHGVRHFNRYANEDPVIIRIPSTSLISENATPPRFCAYNSGSPRCSNGDKSPRGPNTFVEAAAFTRLASQVVEVTFENAVTIPSGAEYGFNLGGPWQPL